MGNTKITLSLYFGGLSALESKLAKRQLAKDLIEYYQHVRVQHQEGIKRIYDFKDFDDAYAIVDERGNIINAHNVQVVPNSVGIEIPNQPKSQILDEFQAIELLNSLNDYLYEYRLGL